ncbi:hypothetical protein [Thermococcus barophilus]|uniref:Uncharacterized protein n=1 Tax=Thermococcus barophilus (strain DSM 11836 / MP) TaxID=391623 RepID=F0LJK9_THEBM|nr:hypothetical protein [Thermococcus barophilus]ADT84651.1 hypothetical protein TERMP_01676 [Thermococcus barophilus MP]
MDENRVLLNYYLFTVPHITVLAGAVLGLLLLLKVDIKKALGIFAVFYGSMLTILAFMVRDHFSRLVLYKLSLIIFFGFTLLGIVLLLT